MVKRKKKVEPVDSVESTEEVFKMGLSRYFRIQNITWEHIIAGKKLVGFPSWSGQKYLKNKRRVGYTLLRLLKYRRLK